MKVKAYYIDENVDAEITEAARNLKQTGIASRVGKGSIIARAWDSYKKTAEYRQIMKGA